MQKDQQLRRYSKKSYFYYITLHCDFDLEVSTPLFMHDTPAHDDAPPNQVCLQKVEQFRRYCLDKIQTHGLMDRVIQIYLPPPPSWGEGGERGGRGRGYNQEQAQIKIESVQAF